MPASTSSNSMRQSSLVFTCPVGLYQIIAEESVSLAATQQQIVTADGWDVLVTLKMIQQPSAVSCECAMAKCIARDGQIWNTWICTVAIYCAVLTVEGALCYAEPLHL